MSNIHTSRRTFIKATGAAAIAAAVPTILHAEDKADAKALVVGSGGHTYEVLDGWAKLPENMHFGDTHAIAETADGRIFVHHNGHDSVCIFDPDGKFIKAWGKYEGAAHGMQLRKEGNEEFLYLAPTGMHKVQKTTLDGEVLWTIEYPKDAKNSDGKPCYNGPDRYVPTNIAFGPNGDFYVADGYGSNYVHQYSMKGEYIRTWGGSGKGEGQLSCPHGIWCDTRDAANPTILVADRSNVRLQWFTLDGKFIKMVRDELRHPCHFDQRNGDLLIPDLHGRVTIFDKDNKLAVHLGDNVDPKKRGDHNLPVAQRVAGQFVTPHGAIWDRAGNIYVGEWIVGGRVTKLRHVA